MAGVSGVWQVLRACPAIIEICHRPAAQRDETAIHTAGSTASGADLTGLVRTPWDGDLHRRTTVDVLPADGMQEVRGSNPRSSTSSCTYFEYETGDHACPGGAP